MIRIITEYDSPVNKDVSVIVAASYAGDYKLDIRFSNGQYRKVNFESFLRKSLHPAIRQYLDKNKFRQFSIMNGNVNWNDYDLIFPVEDLYYDSVERELSVENEV
jgi:hypothetical protein